MNEPTDSPRNSPRIIKIDRTNPNIITLILKEQEGRSNNNNFFEKEAIQPNVISTKAYFLWLNGYSNNAEDNWREAESQLKMNLN